LALVRRYFEEVEYFNATSLADDRSDEESDALAEATFDKTMHEMVGVPARSRDDALAALEWLIKEGADLDELSWEIGAPMPEQLALSLTPSEAISPQRHKNARTLVRRCRRGAGPWEKTGAPIIAAWR
jgi:hypothetical protein